MRALELYPSGSLDELGGNQCGNIFIWTLKDLLHEPLDCGFNEFWEAQINEHGFRVEVANEVGGDPGNDET